MAIAATSPLRENNQGNAAFHSLLRFFQAAQGIHSIRAIHSYMLCSPHCPTKKGNPKEFAFRYPAQLKSRQALNQNRYIDMALMVCHENILPFWIDIAQTSNFQSHATDNEDDPTP